MQHRTATDYRAHILSYYLVYLDRVFGFDYIYTISMALKELPDLPTQLDKLTVTSGTQATAKYLEWQQLVRGTERSKAEGVDAGLKLELDAMTKVLARVDTGYFPKNARDLLKVFHLPSYISTNEAIVRKLGTMPPEVSLAYQFYAVALIKLYRERRVGILGNMTRELAGCREPKNYVFIFEKYLFSN